MSDLTAPLAAAVAEALRADPGVIAACAPDLVRIYDVVPPDAAAPYLELALPGFEPVLAEGFDLSETDVQVHVWSRPATPGFEEARAIAAAAARALAGIQLAAGVRLYAVIPGRTVYLRDIGDPRLIHAVVAARITASA